MPAARSAAARWRLIAAPAPALCLDFVNTRCWRGTPQPTETLAGFDALLGWLESAAALDAAAGASLRALPAVDAAAAQRLVEAALDGRERLYLLLRALAEAAPPPDDALAALARLVAAAPPRIDPVLAPGGSGWRVPLRVPDAAEVLAPVWWSAADLVLGTGRLRLRCCANPRCGWLFVDDSKTGTRRWCAMSACGNRAKAHRHAQRAKARTAAARARRSRSGARPAHGTGVPGRAAGRFSPCCRRSRR